MRPLSECLNILLATAMDIVQKPQMVTRLPDSFAELAAEIERYHKQPSADGARATGAAMVMIVVIEEFVGGPREATSPWLMQAGNTLPLLRVAAWLAFNNEKAARGT
jgi:hypothetical protein